MRIAKFVRTRLSTLLSSFFLLFIILPTAAKAADFTTVSHDLYVNGNGDIYLKARDRIVLLHGDIAIPLTLDPTESSYFLEMDVSQAHGYKAAVSYDEVNAPLDISSYTEYGGLEIIDFNGGNDLFIPDVGAMPHSLVLNGGDSSVGLIASNVLASGSDYVINVPPTTEPSEDTVVTAAEVLATDQVGSLDANFGVSDSGAVTYSVPIYTLPGTAGVAPQISLNYSSSGGNGIAGLGWNIGGLSAVTRCRQTLQQDNNPLPIQWNAEDRFCLDGQRLILVSGTYGSNNSTYRTEIDNFATVTAKNGADGDPVYFVVDRKDGSTSYYGNNIDSSAGDSSSDTAIGKTLTWAINQLEDNVGNKVTFHYTNSPQTNGHYINEIRYAYGSSASNYNAWIEFTYEDRDDESQGYIAGELFSSKKRLDQIEIFSSSSSSEPLRQYDLIYDEQGLGYNTNDKLSRLTGIEECSGSSCLPITTFEWMSPQMGARSSSAYEAFVSDRLNFRAADLNGDGVMDLVYLDDNKRLRYAIANGSASYSIGYFTNGAQYVTPGATDAKLEILDYNADGRQDVVVFCQTSACSPSYRWQVYLSVPQTDGSWKLSSTNIPLTTLTNGADFIAFGDLDSDGLSDVSGRQGSVDLRVESGDLVSSSTFYTFQNGHTLLDIESDDGYGGGDVYRISKFGDFNGDGKADFIGSETDCGWDSYGVYWCGIGGAIVGVMEEIEQSLSGSTVRDFEIWGTLPGDYYDRSLADFNMDGLTDEVYKDGSNWYYRLSNGTSFNTSISTGVLDDYDLLVADYNNDGYPDIYWKNNSSDRLYVKLWDPSINGFSSGTTTVVQGGAAFVTANSDSYLLQDMNSDGLTDLVRVNSSYVRVYYHLDTGEVPNKIVQITDGFGAETDVTYQSIGTSDHYAALKVDTTPGSSWSDSNAVSSSADFYTEINQDYSNVLPTGTDLLETNEPILPIPAGLSIVTDVSTTAPTEANSNAKSSISYYYGKARAQAGGRGILGFADVRVVNNQTGVETTTTYRQDWPFIGRPLRSEARTSAGELISESEITWTVRTQSSSFSSSWEATMQSNGSASLGPLAPYVERSVAKTYDPYDISPTALSTLVTDSTYDGYGNPTNITARQYAGDQTSPTSTDYVLQTETTNTYNDTGLGSTYSKQYGRLTNTIVTKTRKDVSSIVTSARKAVFDYYDDGEVVPSAGVMTGAFVVHKDLLKSESIYLNHTDPDTSPYSTTYHYYDTRGNSVMARTDADSDNDGIIESRYTSLTTYESTGRYVSTVHEPLADSTGSAAKRLITEVVQRDDYGTPTETHAYVDASDYVVSKTYTSARGITYFTTDSTGTWGASNVISGSGSYCPSTTEYHIRARGAGGSEAYECFDQLGRSIGKAAKAFDGSWAYTQTYYDSSGRLVKTTEPSGSLTPSYWTTTQYDDLGRVKQTLRPGVSNPDTLDYDGLKTLYINALGNTKSETRNVLGEIVQVDETGVGVGSSAGLVSSTASYTYDADGNLVELEDAANNLTEVTYDGLGRKLTMDDPDKGFWEYTYNAFGELICQEDAKGQIIQTSYDFRGRRTTRTDRGTGGSCSNPSGSVEGYTEWTYDQADNGYGQLGIVETKPDSGSSPDLSRTTYFDALGRVSRTKTEIEGNSDEHWAKTTYDEFGRVYQSFDAARTSDSYTSNGIQNHYNSHGYLNQITDARHVGSAPNEIYYQINDMDLRGNVTDALYGDLIEANADYNAATGHLSWLTGSAAGTYYQNYGVDWDDVGNLEHRRNYMGSAGGQGTIYTNEEETYVYDGLNRLEKYTTASTNTTLTYNSIGNITSKSDWGGTYTYGSKPSYCNISGAVTPGPHAVSYANSTSYCYDANGNMIQDSTGRTLTYSAFDKVTQITKGGHTTNFEYGPDRARYRRIDSASGATTTTLYLPGVDKIYNDDGTIEWKRDIGVGQITQVVDSSGNVQSETKHYFLKDHLGSITNVFEMNTNGTIGSVEEMAFDPWGARVNPADIKTDLTAAEITSLFNLTNNSLVGSPTTTNGFTGHEMLDEVDVIHMNGRIYDARLGRFLQADPIVQAPFYTASLNRYSYGWNNPLNGIDPSGYSWLSDAWQDFRDYAEDFAGNYIIEVIKIAVSTYVCQGYAAYCYAALSGAQAYSNGASPLESIGVAVGSYYGYNAGPNSTGGNWSGDWAPSIGVTITWGTSGGTNTSSTGGKYTNGACSSSFAFTASGNGCYNPNSNMMNLGGGDTGDTGCAPPLRCHGEGVEDQIAEEIRQQISLLARLEYIPKARNIYLIYDGSDVTVRDDRTGKILVSVQATSGHGEGLNNPSLQDQENTGPIPENYYFLDPSDWREQSPLRRVWNIFRGNGDWGEYNVPLIPAVPHDYRHSFYLHGGYFEGSAGCVDCGSNINIIRDMTLKQGSVTLIVNYPD